jgi:HD-like signal output (HDOD) protein
MRSLKFGGDLPIPRVMTAGLEARSSACAPHPGAQLDQAAEDAVRTIGIPPCPMILTGVVREMRAEDPNFRRIASLISSDVGLAATTIKTANSAFFGLPRPAGTVQDALTYLGVATIAQVLTGLLLRQAFAVSESAAMTTFWERSSGRAALTAKLAQTLRAVDSSVAYTFGLFRDCGMAIMLRKFKGYAELLTGDTADGLLFVHLENERFALDHARIGRFLAHSWQLPETLCNAILHHHDADAMRGAHVSLEPASMRLIALAALVDHLDAAGHGPPSGETLLACSQLEVSPERLAEIAADSSESG